MYIIYVLGAATVHEYLHIEYLLHIDTFCRGWSVVVGWQGSVVSLLEGEVHPVHGPGQQLAVLLRVGVHLQ